MSRTFLPSIAFLGRSRFVNIRMLTWLGMAVLEDLTELSMMRLEQFQHPQCFLVCGIRCCCCELGGCKVMLLASSNGVTPFLFLGCIARMSVGLKWKISPINHVSWFAQDSAYQSQRCSLHLARRLEAVTNCRMVSVTFAKSRRD